MKVALVDERMTDECRRALTLRGFRVIDMPKSRYLSEPVASHPDMLVMQLGDTIVSTADYIEDCSYVFTDIREASDVKIHATDEVCRAEYPYDAILNCLDFGNILFAKCDTASEYVQSLARSLGRKIVNTKQGYPACSVLAFGGKYAITADRGLAETMSSEGIEVLVIDNGGISLPPYEYGFIGGASGICGKTVYFIGNLDTHPSCAKIRAFIEERGYSVVSLGGGTLTDLGKIIFI